MPRPIQDQVVVVTGASCGIGRAIARAFAARGARLGLMARNEEALNAAAGEARQQGTEAMVLPLDVADAEAVERAAAAVEARFGRIDTWVNCAMATVFAPALEVTPEEFRRVTEVTYLGYVWGTQAALRRMLPRDEGLVIQIGSALAYRSIPLQSAYCAAKAAIRGFTDAVRTELIHERSKVKLSMLQLPAVNTPQPLRQRNKLPRRAQPVPPMFRPEAIADAVVWAAEHAPREMLLGRPTLQAVWGQKLFPGLLDRLAAGTWEKQLVDQPNDQEGDVLFGTLPGDPGAHGPYREQEHGPDLQMRLRTHPRLAAVLGGAAAASAVAAVLLRGDDGPVRRG
jgi:NAD(P)-dependent dehydrogenase (short-subunit alcohol dehydrogenase family)